MRVVDVLYSLPYIFLVILLLVFFSRSILMLFVALGLVQWLTMARIVRGQVLSLKQQNFVEAARALGAGDARVIFQHLVPNTLGPVIVYTTLTVPADHPAGGLSQLPRTGRAAARRLVGHAGLGRRSTAGVVPVAGGRSRGSRSRSRSSASTSLATGCATRSTLRTAVT